MTSDSKSIAIVAIGAALAGAAVGATIASRAKVGGGAADRKVAAAAGSSSCASSPLPPLPLLPAAALSCVVFISDGADPTSRGFNVKIARKVSFFELRDAVVGASAGKLDGNSRLFVSVEGGYQELSAETTKPLLAAAASAGISGKGGAAKLKPGEIARDDALIVLAATRDGADLSPEAALRPPPTPVPRGSRGLPFLGNALALKGPHEVPGMNLYKNLFDPKTVKGRWEDTIRISLPISSAAAAALEAEAGVVDDARSVHETIVTSDPEILAELCAREADFPKMWNRPAQLKLQDFTGNGIFTSSTTSDDWQSAHGLLPRSFNAIKLDAMYPSVLDACRGFVRALRGRVERAGGGRARIDRFSDFLTALTADAVVKCAIGLDMRNVARLSGGEPPHAFIPAFRFGLKYASGGANSSDLPASVRYNPLVSNSRALAEKYEEAKATCESIIDDMIERTRLGELSGCGDISKSGNKVDNASSASSPSNGNTSVLATMLNDRAPNGKLIRLGAIQGHVLNLMIAGHETTAATLGFVIHYLSRHPEWEAKVVEEARAVLAGRTEPAASDLRKLVVTEAVFREALRLHPPVVVLTRDASADTTLAQGKYVVRRGQRVMCLLPALHRRDDVWGSGSGYPDPGTFDPSRFLPGDERAKSRPPSAFSPWGFGQRACIGSQFALMEAKCLLCLLYSQLCVETPEGYEAVPSTVDGGAAPVPKGLSVLLYPRAGAPEVAAAAAAAEEKETEVGGGEAKAVAAAAAATAAAPAASPASSAAPTRSIPIRILYGSNGGTCESFASSLAQRASQLGFAATAESLDAAADGSLTVPASSAAGDSSTKGAAVAIITATYNGAPPDNAAKFMKWLASVTEKKPGSAAESAAAPLYNLRYAVFGVGNSQWNLTYLKVAKAIDVGLAAAGAQRVRAFEGADVDGAGAAEAFEDWACALLEGAQAAAGVEGSSAAATKPLSSSSPPPRVKLEMLPPVTPALSSAPEVVRLARSAGGMDAPDFAGEGYHSLKVTQLLASSASASASPPAASPRAAAAAAAPAAAPAAAAAAPQQQRATVHLEVELPAGLAYQAGDHFELIPRNAAPLVDAALELVGLKGDEPVAWTPVNVAGATGGPARGIVAAGRAAATAGKSSGWSNGHLPEGVIRQQPVTARAVLEHLADLSAPCSRRLVAALAAASQCPPEAAALKALASDDGYASGVALPRLSLVDLLSRFKSVDAAAALEASPAAAAAADGRSEERPFLEAFINAHPRLVPRYYSISSSPKTQENRATITVGLVQFITKAGRQHRGPGSGLAHDCKPGDEIVGTVRRLQSTFRYPSEKPETPVVMVGPGTGVAPMIGFLEEREALLKAGKKLGKAVLFFGCRGRADFIFKDRLERWVESGVLTTLHVAMSREEDEEGRKGYVQDWIAKEAVNLWPLLEKENGVVYVCGDARAMAPEVRRSFAGVAASAGGRSQAAAEAFVGAMLEGHRYLEDVWAG